MDFAEFLVRRAIVFAIILLALTLGGVALLKRLLPPPTATPTVLSTPTNSTAALTIDFGDGFSKTYRDLPAPPGSTVLSLLQRAADPARPHALTVDITGSGELAFIRGFDGVGHQGSGPEGRYWQFLINGTLGARGAGATPVNPGDAITWILDRYQPSPPADPTPPK